jgi:predicted O-methyltransferase YrrM
VVEAAFDLVLIDNHEETSVEYLRHARADPVFESLLLPLGKGVVISVKC